MHREVAANQGGEPPQSSRRVAIGAGTAAIVGVAQLAGTLFKGSWYPFDDAGFWWTMLAVWLVLSGTYLASSGKVRSFLSH